MQSDGNKEQGDSRSYQNPVMIGVVLLIAGISVAMIQYKVPTILTELMALFAMDAKAASWLMSIFTLMSIFVALPTGWLAQKFGAKRMMIVACGIAIIGSLVGVASQAQSMARHANINTTPVYSHDLDRVSQAGEFAVDGMLGES